MEFEYSADDAGTWLDGTHGWHNSYRVVLIALDRGFEIPEEARERWEECMDSEPVPFDGPSRDLWEALDADWNLSEGATAHLQELMPEGFDLVWDMGGLSMVAETE